MLQCTLALCCHTNSTVLTSTFSTVWCFISNCQLAYISQMFVLREKERWPYPLAQIIIIMIIIITIISSSSIHKVLCFSSQTLCSVCSSEAFCDFPTLLRTVEQIVWATGRWRQEAPSGTTSSFLCLFYDSSMVFHSSCILDDKCKS